MKLGQPSIPVRPRFHRRTEKTAVSVRRDLGRWSEDNPMKNQKNRRVGHW